MIRGTGKPYLPRAFLATAFLVLLASLSVGGYVGWAHFKNSHLRNELKILRYTLSVFSNDRRLLLIGDSRVAAMSCANNLPGWRALNLGIHGSRADQWSAFLRRENLPRFDAAVLWVGINDILHTKRAGESIARDVASLIHTLNLVSSRVVLISSKDALASTNIALPHWADHELEVLEETLAATVNADHLVPFASAPYATRDYFYVDAVHLSNRGYQVLCAELEKWLAGHHGSASIASWM
jgi:lysophospholipase L1-like esterase